ncbi:MAG: hypothetical protein IJ008_02700 [Clostridia bacterium]|nr:hypothetical protein [Clostridia bacterium]
MEIWNDIIRIIISDGIFAALFIWLFFFQIKDSSLREVKYQKTIEDLTKHLETIEEVKGEIVVLKKNLLKGKKNEKSTKKNEKL